MLAGHMIVLVLMGLIFIFLHHDGKWRSVRISVISIAFGIFMLLLMLVSVYPGICVYDTLSNIL